MKKKNKHEDLQGYYHECMHALFMTQCNIEDFLLKNPGCKANKKIAKKIEQAQGLLSEAYQDFGQIWLIE